MKMDDMAIQWDNIGVFCLFVMLISCAWKAWETEIASYFCLPGFEINLGVSIFKC